MSTENNHYEELTATVQKLTNDLTSSEKIFNNTIGLIRQQRDHANDQIVQHQLRNIHLEEHVNSLNEQLVELNAQILKKDREISSLSHNYNSLFKEFTELKSTVPLTPL